MGKLGGSTRGAEHDSISVLSIGALLLPDGVRAGDEVRLMRDLFAAGSASSCIAGGRGLVFFPATTSLIYRPKRGGPLPLASWPPSGNFLIAFCMVRSGLGPDRIYSSLWHYSSHAARCSGGVTP